MLLTSYENEEALATAILAGAEAYVLKLAGSLDIVDAIRRVGGGRSLIEARETERMTTKLQARMKAISPPLSERDQQVLTLVLEGLTDRQIAERLDSPGTPSGRR